MNEATGVPSLSRDLLYKIEIPTPPKPEQTKIAEILSTVDRAIEQTEALIAKQQRIKTGLMQDLLTRGIDEHGNLRSEQTHNSKTPRWAGFRWSGYVKRLVVWLKTSIKVGVPDCESNPAGAGEWGIPKLQLSCGKAIKIVKNKTLPSRLKPKPSLEIKLGDLLMTRAGPNSRVGVISYVYKTRSKLILSDKIYRLVPGKNVDGHFVMHSLDSSHSNTYPI